MAAATSADQIALALRAAGAARELLSLTTQRDQRVALLVLADVQRQVLECAEFVRKWGQG